MVVTIREDDPGAATTTESMSVTVGEHDTVLVTPAVFSGVEGASSTRTVATFTDLGYATNVPSDFVAMISWGDGTKRTKGAVSAITGGYAIRAAHAYAEEGTYPTSVTVSDPGGPSTGTVVSTATITDAALTGSGSAAFTVTAGVSFSHLLAHFKDADPHRALSDYQAEHQLGRRHHLDRDDHHNHRRLQRGRQPHLHHDWDTKDRGHDPRRRRPTRLRYQPQPPHNEAAYKSARVGSSVIRRVACVVVAETGVRALHPTPARPSPAASSTRICTHRPVC